MKYQNVLEGVFAAAGGVCGFLFGQLDGLLYALMAFALLDYITGVIVAVAEKTLSSAAGFRGLCKKMLLFILVAVGNIIDVQVIGGGSVLRTAVIFAFLVNEGISIIENSAKLGIPIPEKLKNALAQLSEKVTKGEGDE